MRKIGRILSIILMTLVVISCTDGSTSAEHVDNARAYLDQSRYEEAIIELKNALQIDSESAEARWLLGRAYLDLGDILSAEKELELAHDLGWSQDDTVPTLARIKLYRGKYVQVRNFDHSHLEPHAAARLLSTQAISELAQGGFDEADRLVELALELDPGSTEAQIARARILTDKGQFDDALEILEPVLGKDINQFDALSLIGDIKVRQRDLPAALDAYKNAAAHNPNDYSGRLKLALVRLTLRDLEEARRDAKILKKLSPQHPANHYVEGLLLFEDGNYRDAITELESAQPTAKSLPMVKFYVASAHLQEGNTDQAAINARQFVDAMPNNTGGRKLLATILLQQGIMDEVEEILEPVVERYPNDISALNLLANAKINAGKADEGIALLARVAELQPDSPVAQVRLGAGLMIAGQGDDAIHHIEMGLELDPTFQQADILLVLNLLRSKDYPAAIEAAKALRDRMPDSVTPHNLLGKVYLEADQPEEAIKSFEQALQVDPGDPSASHNLAELAIANGNVAQARAYYNKVLEVHENDLSTMLRLATLEAREGQAVSLEQVLLRASNAHPAALRPRIYLGRYYLSQKQPEKIAPLFSTLDEVQRESPEVLYLLALSQLSQQEHESALYTLEKLVESAPDTASGHYLMSMAASGQGDSSLARKELKRALELDENHIPSRVTLATLALQDGSARAFEEQMAILNELSPGHPDVLQLRATVAYRNADYETAAKLAIQAFERAPNQRNLLALAKYLEQAGNAKAAQDLQGDWIDKNPADVAAHLSLADSLRRSGKSEEATALYRGALKLDPGNLTALNNLAWQLRASDPTQALQYAREAYQIAPGRSEILDTLAMVEYENKEYERASQTIKMALKQKPGDPALLYHSAMIEVALGEKASALNTLESLLAAHQEFSEKAAAISLRDSLD